MNRLLPLIFISFFHSSCASPKYEYSPLVRPPIQEAKKPPENPPKKKEPEMVWRCKISNGAGRVFKGIDESRVKAEGKARRECGLFSRNCSLLDCSPQESED